MAYLLAALGLVLLIGGGDILVRGAATLAHRLRVPSMLVGMTIVACGTSAPELVISLDAAVREGVPEMALGNAVGSNIANVLLVLGIPALLAPIRSDARMGYRDMGAMLGATLIFIGLAFVGVIGFWSGLLLVVLLIAFLLYSVRAGQQHASIIAEEMAELERETEDLPSPWMPALFVALGLVGLIIGARLFVSGSIQAARDLGVSEAVIGLSMVAIGTSLPELATSVPAVLRKHYEVAIGNVLGSNIFNLLAIIGITAMVVPIPVPPEFLRIDLWVMLGTSLLLIPLTILGREMGKLTGAAFLAGYVAYLWMLF